MNTETLKEMWQNTVGGEMPAAFENIVASYKKYKCALYPLSFNESDFAACVMLYQLATAMGGINDRLDKLENPQISDEEVSALEAGEKTEGADA